MKLLEPNGDDPTMSILLRNDRLQKSKRANNEKETKLKTKKLIL